MSGPSSRTLVLSVHPVSQGFGWIAFEGPLAPYDWGVVQFRKATNARSLAKIEHLIERLKPEALALEAFALPGAVRSKRVSRLYQAIVSLASDQGVEVGVYTRGQVQACFKQVGAQTRQEIAEAVARSVPALRSRLPRKRRAWDSEDKRMALFSAAALVLTHYAFGASRLFDDLKDAS